MAETQTPNYDLIQPEVGGSTDTWGGSLNDNMDTIDREMFKALKNDASEEANSSNQLRLGGFVFSLDGTAPALPADPETRSLIITCNGVVVFRLDPEAAGLTALDIIANDPV